MFLTLGWQSKTTKPRKERKIQMSKGNLRQTNPALVVRADCALCSTARLKGWQFCTQCGKKVNESYTAQEAIFCNACGGAQKKLPDLCRSTYYVGITCPNCGEKTLFLMKPKPLMGPCLSQPSSQRPRISI
jgi:DNA-directed RNA polymerase subunit RPC12/RpoP